MSESEESAAIIEIDEEVRRSTDPDFTEVLATRGVSDVMSGRSWLFDEEGLGSEVGVLRTGFARESGVCLGLPIGLSHLVNFPVPVKLVPQFLEVAWMMKKKAEGLDLSVSNVIYFWAGVVRDNVSGTVPQIDFLGAERIAVEIDMILPDWAVCIENQCEGPIALKGS